MSDKRAVWATLAELLGRLNQETPSVDLAPLEQELRKLGKGQFKSNTLAEEQAARWEKALAALEAGQARAGTLEERLVAERVAAARQEWAAALLPTLDGLDQALESGRRFLESAGTDERSAAFSSWLTGIQLVRERLLDLLQAQGVTPVLTVGEPFDPYQHVAVAVVSEGSGAPGTIVAEERRGYRTAAGVLRYAEVVVYRPNRVA
jgi:molecular chaperone GrpE (heat shock protein)